MAFMKGKGFWVKVLGKPHKGYDENKNEWSFDFTPDAESLVTAKKQGILPKLRDKGDERGKFFTFRRGEFKGDGVTANQPIEVVDHHGQPWNPKTLIGNGSTLNVKYNVYEGRKGNKPIVLAIQVWDLVPYERKPGGPNDFPTKDDEGGGQAPAQDEFPTADADDEDVA